MREFKFNGPKTPINPDGVYEKLRKEELGRLESTDSIHKRLPRGRNGEAELNIELIATFESLMMEGNTRKNAARVVGLSQKTMARWLRKGAGDIEGGESSLEADFTWMVDRCEGEQERMLSRAAFRMAMGERADGTLAVKILERRNPDEWAPALPDTPDTAAQYAGMQAAALKVEVRRVLKTIDKSEETVVVPEAKLESDG